MGVLSLRTLPSHAAICVYPCSSAAVRTRTRMNSRRKSMRMRETTNRSRAVPHGPPVRRNLLLILSLLGFLVGCIRSNSSGATIHDGRSNPDQLPHFSGTFSIVAVDPETGVCGAAVASMYPAVGRVALMLLCTALAGIAWLCFEEWKKLPADMWLRRKRILVLSRYLTDS